MNSILSIYFDEDRIYIAVLKKNSFGFSISYINSTKNAFDFINPNNINSSSAIMELNSILNDINEKFEECNITFAPKDFLFSFIPFSNITDEINQYINIEFLHTFNGYSSTDFEKDTIYLKIMNNSEMLLLSLLHKEYLEILNNNLQNNIVKRLKFNPRVIINSFIFNYPEVSNNTNLLFNLTRETLNIILVKNNTLIYYNENPYKNTIEELCLSFISNIYESIPINNIYFLGNLLNKDLLNVLTDKLKPFVLGNVQRFNTFRMLHCELSERQKQYCSRVAHLLAPCVGSNLLDFQ